MNDTFQKAHNFLINEGFQTVNNSSYPLLQKYNHCSLLQEKNGTMFVTWQNTYFGLYKIINNCLCCVFFHEGRDIYWTIQRPQENALYPLKPIVDLLCALCKKAGLPFLQVKFIDRDLLAEYESVHGYQMQTTYNIDNSEYAYAIKDLLNLAGPNNYYKRKRINRILAMQDISVCPITSSNAQLCLEIQKEWCSQQDCSYCSSFFGCEQKAIQIMLEIFDDKIHNGLVMYNGKKPDGYIICEKINKKLSFLYFGKSNIDGGVVYLIYLMYCNYIKDVEYMNISEDMGHQGLRTFKKLLSPFELWHKYVTTYQF